MYCEMSVVLTPLGSPPKLPFSFCRPNQPKNMEILCFPGVLLLPVKVFEGVTKAATLTLILMVCSFNNSIVHKAHGK